MVEGALGVGQVGVRRWPGGPKERSVGAHQAPHGSGGLSTGDSGRGLRGGEHATDGFDNWRSMSRYFNGLVSQNELKAPPLDIITGHD